MPQRYTDDTVASLLDSIDSIMEKTIQYEERKETKMMEFAKALDKLEIEKGNLTYEDIMNGILASPAGEIQDFLKHLLRYKQQKNKEKVLELTKKLKDNFGISALIKMAEHAQKWDKTIMDSMVAATNITNHVNATYRKPAEYGEEKNPDDEEEERKKKFKRTESKEIQAKYRVN